MRDHAAARPAPARRRLFGQHVTRNDVSDLICAFCLRRADASVLDPACGSGDMLRRAAARLARLAPEGVLHGGRLTGTEIDPLLAARAREALPGAEIRTADFLAGGPRVQPRLFDAIVGNPPYVRQELLDTARKRALRAALPPLPGAPAASRRADLHLYFWPRALELLAPGGRLGFITSAAWLDAAYGAWLRRCLSDGFRVVAVIESAVESWFDDARVRSAVTVIERVSPAGAPPARFVRLEARLEDLVPLDRDEPERLAGFEELARRLGRDTPADPIAPAGSSIRIRRVPAGALGADPWGPALRMPEIYFEILAQAAGRLIPLAEVAEVRWGIKTGDDSFFCPDRDEAASFDPRFVVPIAFSLMELDRLEVRSETLRRRLLRIDTRRPDHREALAGP
ncbi:MAG TPA: N-6 DNA methylase, partial [Candidatus Polarisedimenticolia bacterium]|nr:N-6 DNA methylase [Candidatus Polarisedimenticolia bacterium]